jgi:hypothetical protein
LVGLNENRKQDRGYWSPISTAVHVLLGDPSSVEQAQEMVGDPVDTTALFDPHGEVDLTEDERDDLAERCIVQRPVTGKYVVWFRLYPAFVKSVSCVTHGEVTFSTTRRCSPARSPTTTGCGSCSMRSGGAADR